MSAPEGPEVWRSTFELAGSQALAVGALAGLALAGPLGSAGWLAVPIAGPIVGAFAWARLRGRRLGRLDHAWVRALSARVGALAAPLAAASWAGVAAIPGQIDAPGRWIPVLAVLIGSFLGGMVAALSLCGLDLGRERATTRAPPPPRA